LNQFIRGQIDKGFKNRKWKIISLMREPISRNISTFFENLQVDIIKENEAYQIASEYYGFGPLTVKMDNLNELVDIYFKCFRHDTPLTFFDVEFKGVLKFDVFEHPFQPLKGYAIYPGENFDVMLIRLENLNSVAETAFAEFLDLKSFRLVSSNIGQEKIYAPLYKKFKQEVVFPKRYLDRFYHSRFMKHFYSEAEIKRMRSTWKCKD